MLHIRTIAEVIQQRRYQMLVHSFIYYQLNQSIVSDHDFDKWAKELVVLQERYPDIAKTVVYHNEFKAFDGSSGFDLPYNLPEIQERAMRVLEEYKKRQKRLLNIKSPSRVYLANFKEEG